MERRWKGKIQQMVRVNIGATQNMYHEKFFTINLKIEKEVFTISELCLFYMVDLFKRMMWYKPALILTYAIYICIAGRGWWFLEQASLGSLLLQTLFFKQGRISVFTSPTCELGRCEFASRSCCFSSFWSLTSYSDFRNHFCIKGTRHAYFISTHCEKSLIWTT